MRTHDPRETFNAAASLYAASRPDYPPELFNRLAEVSGLGSSDSVLEIGCGTGLATQGLVRLSNRITALDPGAELLRIAKERLENFPTIEFVQTTFEAWPPSKSDFKLVAAAQAIHWVSPQVGLPKIASLLRPGGTLAVFGNVPILPASPLSAEIGNAYEQHAPHLAGPPPESWYLPSGPIPNLISESPHFSAVSHRSYSRVFVHTASSFSAFRQSQSSHQLLPPQQLERLLKAIAAAIHDQGGKLELRIESHLYTAQRVA
jgi:ubiquinone/menaquinone biosynthesis C-methylase UbiE